MSETKPTKPKPQFYAQVFAQLQIIAKDHGYNLVIHGSMSRDMDLVAIPWVDDPKGHMELIYAFCDYLGAHKYDKPEYYLHSILPGGRSSYVINLFRGSKLNNHVDVQYYLDISITPLVKASEVVVTAAC